MGARGRFRGQADVGDNLCLGRRPKATMRSTLKRLAKLTAGYSLVTLLGPLFTLLLTPLYTRVLEPADYGVVDISLTVASLIGIFVGLGMDQALSGHFFDGDDSHQRDVVTTALACVAGIGLVGATSMVLLAAPLATILFGDPARAITLEILSISVICGPLYIVTVAALRLRMGIRRVNILGLTNLFSVIGFNLLFVLLLRWKATGVVAANAAAMLVSCLVGMALIAGSLRGSVRREIVRTLLPTGFAILPALYGSLLLNNIDRLLLTQYVPAEQIGLYAIANKLASMVTVVVGAAWAAWWPMALQMADEVDAPRQFARMLEYFLMLSITLALAMGMFSGEILSVFTRAAYVPSAPYAFALMIYTGPIASAATFFCIGLHARKRAYKVSVAFLISAVINIGLNLILDPIIGIWGAVWATVIGGMVLMVLCYRFGQQVLLVQYRWIRIAVVFAFHVGACLLLIDQPGLNTVPAKLGLLVTLFTLYAGIGFIRREQFITSWNLLQSRFRHQT